MKKRIVSLWFPRLTTDRIQRQRGVEWASRPLATVVESGSRIMLAGVTRSAEQAGLVPGMALADARAVVAELATVPADIGAEAALLARLARWCGRYTPIVAIDGTDGLFLDVTGCAHLFGGETKMVEDMMGRLEALGFSAAAALADTPGAAWALARFGSPGTVAPPGAMARALERLPVGALRLDRQVAAGLAQSGLRRIGDLYGMPRGAIAARFGSISVLRLDQALGHAEEPLRSFRPVAMPRERIAFAEPIGKRSDIDMALRHLLVGLSASMECTGRGARRLELAFHTVDGAVQVLIVGTARALRDADVLARLFRDKLDGVDPGFGIEAMVLSAPANEPLAPAQGRLDEGRDEAVAAVLIDRLGNRFGFDKVNYAVPVDSHSPDRAWRRRPALSGGKPEEGAVWPTRPLRPVRMFSHPHPVEAEVPAEAAAEGGPLAAFRWRGRRHAVRRAEGPERIAPEWWRLDPAWASGARDYWRIEDETGRRFWLSHTVRRPEWRLHGLFG